MNKVRLFFALNLLATGFAFSQDTLYKYYDAKWAPASKSNYVYLRKYFKNAENTYTVFDYYASGKLQMSGNYLSEDFKKRTGTFIYYYETGVIQSIEHLLNDSTVDYSESNYPDGKRKSLTRVVNGKDTYWGYYSNGKTEMISQMYKHRQHGHAIYYHDNGNLSSEGEFENGFKTGEWKYYNLEGEYIQSEYHVINFELPCDFEIAFGNDRWINVGRESHGKRIANVSMDLFMRKSVFDKNGNSALFMLTAACFLNIENEKQTADYIAKTILENKKVKGKKVTNWNNKPIELNGGVLYAYTEKVSGKKQKGYLYVLRNKNHAAELFFTYDPNIDEAYLNDMFDIIKNLTQLEE